MKTRLGIVALLLLATLPPLARAQYSDLYYHRVGDTVDWDTHIGYYSWWEWEYFYENDLMVYTSAATDWSPAYVETQDSCIKLQYFYTPVPLKIIGIAGSCIRGWQPYAEYYLDTNEVDEYLYIYDAGPGDTFTQVAATRWSPFDPKRYIRIIMHAPGNATPYDSCCGQAPLLQYVPISEYYFEDEVWVTDSFYVGGSFYGCIVHPNTPNDIYTRYRVARMLGYMNVCDPDHQVLCGPSGERWTQCAFPNVTIKQRAADFSSYPPAIPFSDNGWRWYHNRQSSVIIYPIIEVDTTVPPEGICIPVGNVAVTVNGATATVTWDDFPNYTAMRLRYGSRALPQSEWNELTLPAGTTLYTLNLPPNSAYGVTLMAECDKKETKWCDPLYFYTGEDTNTGIDAPTMLSELTFVHPNPAKDEMTVSSSFSLQRIELHDASGVLVYSEMAFGHQVTLDIGFLRNGSYIVTIQTHNGTTHKRLVVAK